MSEIAACTLIQEEPDRKTERYMMMFKDYPDVVSVDILQEMLGICRKNAYLLVKQNKIHSARVGRSYKIPKLCVVEYLIDQNRQLGGMRLSNSLAPSLQNTSESSKLMMPKQRTFGCEQTFKRTKRYVSDDSELERHKWKAQNQIHQHRTSC